MRPIGTTTDSALSATITQPYYLVYINFPTPGYFTTYNNDIDYAGNTYLASPMEVDPDSEPKIRFLNENGVIGQTILASGVAGREVKVYRGDVADTEVFCIFHGEGGSAVIEDYVTIECKQSAPIKTPRHICAPPLLNHITPPGTRFRTPTGVIILEA